jgi:hypothetical protein
MSNFADLDLRHYSEDVILALEVVEKGSFSDVGGLGDIFDRYIGQSMLGDQGKSTTEKPQTGLGGASLAPA